MNRPALQMRVPRIAETAVERARLAVVPRQRSSAPRVPFLVLVSTVILVGFVGLLLFNTEMQKASIGGRQLEAEKVNLTVRNQDLSQKLQGLRSYKNISARAQGLGMVLPASLPFLDLKTGAVNGEVVTASEADRVPLKLRGHTSPLVIAAREEAARKAAAAKAAADKAARDAAARKARQQTRSSNAR